MMRKAPASDTMRAGRYKASLSRTVFLEHIQQANTGEPTSYVCDCTRSSADRLRQLRIGLPIGCPESRAKSGPRLGKLCLLVSEAVVAGPASGNVVLVPSRTGRHARHAQSDAFLIYESRVGTANTTDLPRRSHLVLLSW